MSLTYKERELANIGASVATGCKPCTDYHFKKVREAGASDEEIKKAISIAIEVREKSKEIMESHGLKHLGFELNGDSPPGMDVNTRIDELVCVASAYSINCTSSVENHIAAAKAVGITEKEIESVLAAAHFIKGEAAHYVDQMVKLKEEKNQLEELLEKLERTQAQLVQSEKMAALGKLVAGVVHEMNSPLGVMNSSSDTLNRSIKGLLDEIDGNTNLESLKKSPRFSKSVKVLRDNSRILLDATERIRKVVTSFKAFARLDEANYQKTDLHEGLENTLALIEQDLKDEIRVMREYGDIPEVFCHPGEANQVFLNLITNAANAIPERGSITVRTYEKNGNVHVQIVDNGIGISEEKLANLFDPTFTMNGTRIKAGLGLFTSSDIMQKHHGRIEVESEIGKGSKFTVIFPFLEAQNIEAVEPPQHTDRCAKLDQKRK